MTRPEQSANVQHADNSLNVSRETSEAVSQHASEQNDSEHQGSEHLLGANAIHALAHQLGIRPTKKLGQNFMIDPGTVRRIAHIAGVTSASTVLEVGPGLGSLTLALLETGAHVTAVEIDKHLAQQLPRTVEHYQPEALAEGRFSLITADALSLTPEVLRAQGNLIADDPNHPFSLVSNLPYNVAVPILLTLLDRCDGLASATVLVQDEVADRLSAEAGSKTYGAPSVKLAWYGNAEKAGKVGRNVFWPVPNVDSALVAFTRTHVRNDGCDDDDKTYAADKARAVALKKRTFALIDAAFAQRRKTLRAALKGMASADQIEAAGIDPTVRGEKLSAADFTRLASVLEAAAKA